MPGVNKAAKFTIVCSKPCLQSYMYLSAGRCRWTCQPVSCSTVTGGSGAIRTAVATPVTGCTAAATRRYDNRLIS